ncbi:alpha/beta hydrolase family protein [Streptomyces sp. NPDC014685]|uniref:S9 family peptidase n=1 Tax=Streptomyces sp. NPDC014685 TaxID=3364881 RepID=UPI0036FE8870
MTRPPDRISFRFSARSRHAACLVSTAEGGFVPARWDLGGTSPRYREGTSTESTATQVLPTDDGELLLLRSAVGSGRHRLALTGHDGGAGPATTIAARGLRLVPGGPPDTLALAVETDAGGRTRVWQVRNEPLRLAHPVMLPGRITGLLPLDEEGIRYVTDLGRAGGCRPVVLNLREATWGGFLLPEGGHIHRVLLSAPRSGLLLTASDPGDGRLRIGRTTVDGRTALSFPERLNSLDGSVFPLAADPAGERVALRVTKGAAARLFRYDVADDRPSPTRLPAGAVHPAAGWNEHGLHVVYANPARPADLVTVPDDPARQGTLPPPAPAARTEWFDTPDGGFEAVCLGDWRTADTVTVALHGGPEDAWTLGFHPVLHRLSEAGTAVVAPNQRGSTGYGRAHTSAVHGAWGIPDLADIRALVRTLTEHRPPGAQTPALLGVSYGGFLALLAVCADPHAWSRCAAAAPFLSARGLYERATPAVRALIERHGLGTPPDDELGPRDVELLAHRIRVPLLVVHGTDDPLVPVEETRRLRKRLIEAGRVEHTHFACLEGAGVGHDLLQERAGAGLTDRLVTFLTPGPAATARPAPDLTAAHATV